jgi:hypothetical protein
MLRLALAFLLFAVALTIVAVREHHATAPLQEEVREVTLKELLVRGASEHPHVSLTQFEFTNRFVFAESRFTSGWRAVWFPIVPPAEGKSSEEDVRPRLLADSPGGPIEVRVKEREGTLPVPMMAPERTRAIIMTQGLNDEQGLREFIRQRRLQARVAFAADCLEKRDRELLQSKFAGIDLGTCLIIQPAGELRGRWLFYVLAVATGFAYLTAVGLVIASRRLPRRPSLGKPDQPAQAAQAAQAAQSELAGEQLDAWQRAVAKRQESK